MNLPTDTSSSSPAASDVASSTTTNTRPKWRWLWWSLAFLAGASWVLASGVRYFIQDQSATTATLFYGTPIPVLVALAVVASESFRMLGKRRLSRSLLAIGLAQLVFWLPNAIHFRSQETPREALRLVFWNVSRGLGGYKEMAREMLEYGPDIICMVEATAAGQKESTWAEHLPGFKIHRLGSGMMIMVRGEAFGVEPGMIRDVARYRNIRVRIGKQQFGLCLIDIRSDPLVPRNPAFEALPEILDRFQKLPHLLVGDFNTPVESTLFRSIKPEMRNAFEERGSGYRETWPVFAPVLSLDQVWSNNQIEVHSCRHGWSWRSDHRPVIVEFTVK